MSILSFPERGPWGNSQWKGNCTGHVYRSLFDCLLSELRSPVFIDPMVGSGTSVQVAAEMGIRAHGFDLHSGFNVLTDSIVEAAGEPGNLVLSHPPYGNMIVYSGEVWGNEPHPADLSRCSDDEDFHQKLQVAMLNQREATVPGGYYGTIIGDLRRDGRYISYQSEVIARCPSDELAAVLIKQQHNCTSDSKVYRKMRLPRITHEYIILFRKRDRASIAVLKLVANQAQSRLRGTWKAVVRTALTSLGGRASLTAIYESISRNTDKVQGREHWQAKVRQTLQLHEDFVPVERGVWSLA